MRSVLATRPHGAGQRHLALVIEAVRAWLFWFAVIAACVFLFGIGKSALARVSGVGA